MCDAAPAMTTTKRVTFGPLPEKVSEEEYDREIFGPSEGECPMWHPYKCFIPGATCVMKPNPKGGKRSGTLNKMMDMAIYQAISKKPILVKNKPPIHPIMPMERIMALIDAGVNPAFKRQAGEDVMTAALLNQRVDIVQQLQEVHGLSITPSHMKYMFGYFNIKSKQVSEQEDVAKQTERLERRVAELEGLLQEETAKKLELERELEDYRDIVEDLPQSASPEKLKKMLAQAIKQTEVSYQRVKDMEATMHEMFESAHRKKRTRHS